MYLISKTFRNRGIWLLAFSWELAADSLFSLTTDN